MNPRHNIDHYMVLGCLRDVTLRENQCYLDFCIHLLIYPPKRSSHEDKLFASLRQAVPKKPAHERAHSLWILEETWWLIEDRVSLQRYRQIPTAPSRPRPTYKIPSKRGSTEKGDWVGHINGYPPIILPPPPPPFVKDTRHQIQGWNYMATNLPPLTNCITLDHIMVKRVDIYLRVPPTWVLHPIDTAPFTINYSIPSMDKVGWSLRHLWCHRSGGASGIRSEHLQYWLMAAIQG